LDELDDLLNERSQHTFDLAFDRERRRDEQGYVTPAQARAFLQMARELRLESETMPPANPVARAFFRSLVRTAPAEGAADLVDILRQAGTMEPQVRALLSGPHDQTNDRAGALQRIREHMQTVFDRDQIAYTRRNEELTYLANTLMAGCAIQGRAFTADEASEAAVAVCNVALENWPPRWNPPTVDIDLVTVFQVGWRVLHQEVGMYTAERLLHVLAGFRCSDPNIQRDLDALRVKLSKSSKTGTPWRARQALDVIAILDMPAWAVLLALIDECPVLHAVLGAPRNTRTVSPSAFEFISENSQIASIREFVHSLPEMLCP
jgi:hypothetical protein